MFYKNSQALTERSEVWHSRNSFKHVSEKKKKKKSQRKKSDETNKQPNKNKRNNNKDILKLLAFCGPIIDIMFSVNERRQARHSKIKVQFTKLSLWLL